MVNCLFYNAVMLQYVVCCDVFYSYFDTWLHLQTYTCQISTTFVAKLRNADIIFKRVLSTYYLIDEMHNYKKIRFPNSVLEQYTLKCLM